MKRTSTLTSSYTCKSILRFLSQKEFRVVEYGIHALLTDNSIKDKPKYPVIYDSNNVVLSLPPIINSNHSKITLDTKNVFIEITATDKTKLEVCFSIVILLYDKYLTTLCQI
jgi:hypothetical protein